MSLAGPVLAVAASLAVPGPTAIDVATGAQARIEAPRQGLLHVVAFATWCPPCVDELPALADLEARFAPRGYELVLVAVPSRQSLERLRRFREVEKLPGRLLFDSEGTVEAALGVERIPTHLWIDASGRVRLTAGALSEVDVATIEGLYGPPARAAGGR